VYASTSGSTLQFRSFVAATNKAIVTQSTNTISIDVDEQNFGAVKGTSYAIGVTVINATGWGYLASINQNLSTASTVAFDGLTVTNTINGSISGNAATATQLQTARTINGVSFNGTANITVTAAASTLTGTTLASNVIYSSLQSFGSSGVDTQATGGLVFASSPIPASSTTGFLNIPVCTSAPSGNPGVTTSAPIVFDSANQQLKLHNGTSWLVIGPSSGSSSLTFEYINNNIGSYPYTLTYDGNDRASVQTFTLPGGTIDKTFNYDGVTGLLTSIVLTATPSSLLTGVDTTKTMTYTGSLITGATYS
jgi:hypothetical protein